MLARSLDWAERGRVRSDRDWDEDLARARDASNEDMHRLCRKYGGAASMLSKIYRLPVVSIIFLFISLWETESFAPRVFSGKHNDRTGSAATAAVQSKSGVEAAGELTGELVSILLNKRGDGQARMRVHDIVGQLVSMQVDFDPKQCLDGPLFVSHIISGPRPLWEKVGLTGSNIQGQQYVYNEDEMSVINYAQILGHRVHLRAYGTFEKDSSSNIIPAKESTTKVPLFPIFDAMGTKNTCIKCPSDFVVTVNRACISIFGQQISVPIAGTGYLRVLYADPLLRIFVSI